MSKKWPPPPPAPDISKPAKKPKAVSKSAKKTRAVSKPAKKPKKWPWPPPPSAPILKKRKGDRVKRYSNGGGVRSPQRGA
jgi:hypothetical protein